MFQRYAFDNLPPERKMELLEKQRKQQQQREILQQQIETRKREKDIEKEKEAKRNSYQEHISNYQSYPPQQTQFQSPSSFQYQVPQKNQTNTIDFSKTTLTPNNFRKQQFAFTPQNYSLLPNKIQRKSSTCPTHERQLISMTLTPNTIHDAFASLRRQIMTTAASSVIGGGADSRQPRDRKISDTF